MSLSMLESKVNRLQREINQLEQQRAKATKEESNALKKINSASSSIGRTKSLTTIRNKEKEIQRENEKVQKAKEKQGKILSQISKKNSELNKAINDLSNTRQKEQMDAFKNQEAKIENYKLDQIHAINKMSHNENDDEVAKEYDVFISHSADDKNHFVNDLAEALKSAGVTIWYDTDSIGWGKSIRQEI